MGNVGSRVTVSRGRRIASFALVVTALSVGGLPVPQATADLVSYAIVQQDGTLKVRGKTIRLYGILVPENERQCLTNVRPARCFQNRAAKALALKIQGFVRCREVAFSRDGSIDAFCAVDASPFDKGVDLGAYLIREGLAVALPDAPFEYHALERIARVNGRGVWGFQVDSIGPRHSP